MGLKGTYEIYTAPLNGCIGPCMKSFDVAIKHAREGSSYSEMYAQTEKHMIAEARHAVGITEGLAERDGNDKFKFTALKAQREASFPMKLAEQALEIRIQDGDATREEDKKHILNYFVHRTDSELVRGSSEFCMMLESEPHKESPMYDKCNERLRGRFAITMWKSILCCADHKQRKALKEKCTKVLRESGLTKIIFSMRGCQLFNESELKELVAALPKTNLRKLHFDLEDSQVQNGRPLLEEMTSTEERLAVLEELCLPDCQLKCSLEDTICHCSNLEVMRLESNQMTGCLPAELGACTKLRDLFLFNNKFTGEIPQSIGQLHILQRFYSGHNL